ncbi:MAG: transporter [Bacteroidetes bacterium]|nr:transporter [Bacteroidota bacterium]
MTFKFTTAVVLLLFSLNSLSQGCVAIRSNCGVGGSNGNGSILKKGEFLASANFRYFESYKHFRGTTEETDRVEKGTQVINNSFFSDITLNYGITNRWYGAFTLPVAYHLRSSMYEHGGNPPNGKGERHETSSFGLADIRLGGGFWLFDPSKKERFNYSVGLGVKLPTGNYNVTDEFYNQGTTKDSIKVMVVDQSIQLGDGGYGITIDIQGFQFLTKKLFLTTNLYYMSNPMTDNGVLTRSGSQYFSCPDQYAARLGLSYASPVEGLILSLGGRWEGVPSDDLIGSSAGYRRPGYVISIDPGVSYIKNNLVFNLGVPVAVERNRVQSYQDKLDTQNTGVFKQGDAAFADYVINFSVAYKIVRKDKIHVDMPAE